MVKQYQDYVKGICVFHADIASQAAEWKNLETVLDWMKKRGASSGSIDLISQDEFESDFLIELEPDGRWLALGVT